MTCRYESRKDAVSDSDSAEDRVPLTPGQWARRKTKFFVSLLDVSHGYMSFLKPTDVGLRATLVVLAAYSIWLLYSERSLSEYYKFATNLYLALESFFSGTRGTLSAAVVLALSVWLTTVLWLRRLAPVYLIDFKTYRHACAGGPKRNTAGKEVTYERFLAESKAARHLDGSECFNQKSMEFQEKILKTSCISETSIFPPSIFKEEVGQDAVDAERLSLNMKGAREEAELMMFRAVEDVLEATGTKPEDIDILVVNCSLFCPTPSLSAMIINHFRMRSDIASYNLGGMGCSASVVAVDLVKRLLRSPEQRNNLALVVSTENITQNWYRGNDRSMLLSNCLFRCGAAALLLSNRNKDRHRARFALMHIVRTHTGQKDDCYNCVFQDEDGDGVKGVRLSKQIMQVAGDALKINISSLGPLVLPVSEQLRFFANMLARNAVRGRVPLPGPLRRAIQSIACTVVPLLGSLVGFKPEADASEGRDVPKTDGDPSQPLKDASKTPRGAALAAVLSRQIPPYVPDFTTAFEWICVHTGGRAVIDAIENNLALPSYYLEPSRLALYRYGNTSSASIWYELEIVSEQGNSCGTDREGGVLPPKGCERRLCRGDRVWQIAFGSGFKCNSAVWRCLRDH